MYVPLIEDYIDIVFIPIIPLYKNFPLKKTQIYGKSKSWTIQPGLRTQAAITDH